MALETDSSAEGSAAHAVQQPPEANQAIPPARLTNFFIEDILKPEFGKKRDSSSQRDSDGCKVEDADEDSLSSLHDARDGAKLAREPILWPAWVYCTRYSDRPSSGPRSRKLKKKEKKPEEKRPRTAFTNEQLQRLKKEFEENRYLTENRRQDLARELKLNESQIKIWFQNKRAKMKKATGVRNGLALQLMAQGLYNHSTVALDEGMVFEEKDRGSLQLC